MILVTGNEHFMVYATQSSYVGKTLGTSPLVKGLDLPWCIKAEEQKQEMPLALLLQKPQQTHPFMGNIIGVRVGTLLGQVMGKKVG